MENFEIDERRMNFLKRSNAILEHTKINLKEYQSARLILFAFTNEASPDYQLWENLIRICENIIALEEKVKPRDESKISRTVDELGRVVIPLELREKLRHF